MIPGRGDAGLKNQYRTGLPPEGFSDVPAAENASRRRGLEGEMRN